MQGSHLHEQATKYTLKKSVDQYISVHDQDRNLDLNNSKSSNFSIVKLFQPTQKVLTTKGTLSKRSQVTCQTQVDQSQESQPLKKQASG